VLAIRLAETMRLKGKVGTATSSIAKAFGRCHLGKRADWCDYYGPVEGNTVGIAIFDHPRTHGIPPGGMFEITGCSPPTRGPA
jgi:hypothetical protein